MCAGVAFEVGVNGCVAVGVSVTRCCTGLQCWSCEGAVCGAEALIAFKA